MNLEALREWLVERKCVESFSYGGGFIVCNSGHRFEVVDGCDGCFSVCEWTSDRPLLELEWADPECLEKLMVYLGLSHVIS